MTKSKMEIKTKRRKWFQAAEVATSLIAAIASLIAGVLSNLAASGLSKYKSFLGIIALFAALLVTTTFLVLRYQRRPSKAIKLKDDIENAYLKALDNSELNPDRIEGREYG